jgi:hypothetical protein
MVDMRVPIHFYGGQQPDPATEIMELGERAYRTYDEGNALEHRFAAAGGPPYGSPPAHWRWMEG